MSLFWQNKNLLVAAADQQQGQVGPPSGSPPVGVMLRRRREGLGLELAEIGAALKIKPGFIAALEEGRPDQLPGPAYAAGFLRAYGEYLGFDGSEVLRRFEIEAGGLDAKPDLSFPMALGERSVPGGTMLLVALILALCGYGAWYYLSPAEHLRLERVSEVPPGLLRPNAAAAPKPSPPAPATAAARSRPPANPAPASRPRATPPPAGTSATPGISTADAAPPPSPVSGAEAAQPAGPAAALAAPPASAAAGPTPAAAAGGRDGAAGGTGERARPIVIRATADSWIEVRDADNDVLVNRTLKPGESYRVPDRPGLRLWTGNAGGLSILIAGKPAPGIGPMGAVRRNVSLEPEALLGGAAVRQ